MKIVRTDQFERDFKKLPDKIKRSTEKALRFLVQDYRHPSLHTKRVRRTKQHWEARVTKTYRLVFTKEGDTYTLYAVGSHEVIDRFEGKD